MIFHGLWDSAIFLVQSIAQQEAVLPSTSIEADILLMIMAPASDRISMPYTSDTVFSLSAICRSASENAGLHKAVRTTAATTDRAASLNDRDTPGQVQRTHRPFRRVPRI